MCCICFSLNEQESYLYVLNHLRDHSLYTEINTEICITPLVKCMFVLQSRREYKISKLYYQFYCGDEEEIYLDALHHLRDLNLFTRTNLLYLSSSIFAVCFAQHCFRMFIIDIQKQLYLSCKYRNVKNLLNTCRTIKIIT